MINSSYQVLTNVVSSFTRAGGAAQRVMSLMDNLPDIDPFVGEELGQVKGDLELDEVEFVYQMRPDQKVLKGVSLKIGAGKVIPRENRESGIDDIDIDIISKSYHHFIVLIDVFCYRYALLWDVVEAVNLLLSIY